MEKLPRTDESNTGTSPNWRFETVETDEFVKIVDTTTNETAVIFFYEGMRQPREATVAYAEVECEMMNDRLDYAALEQNKQIQSHLMKNDGSRYF